MDLDSLIAELKKYFSLQPTVEMAFIFGSQAKGRAISESDFDIAVYFKPAGKDIEWEEDKEYEMENKIWLETEKIVKKNVDLIILNRASSTLAFEILRAGKIIIIKNRMLYLRFFSRVSFEAIDFMGMIEDYWAIKQRSHSLTRDDKIRLRKAIDFLGRELAAEEKFIKLSWEIYNTNDDQRRNVERWVENIVNCSIDIAKLLLASGHQRMPDTYKEMMQILALLPNFEKNTAEKLAEFAKLRNLLAHEYLDLRFDKISQFIKEAMPIYQALINYIKKILETKS